MCNTNLPVSAGQARRPATAKPDSKKRAGSKDALLLPQCTIDHMSALRDSRGRLQGLQR